MPNSFQTAYYQLLRECFEGRPEGQEYTWFVEGTEGMFDGLDAVSAERASVKPSGDCASVAGHAYHVRYALANANRYLGGPGLEGDWESSWAKQSVSVAEWAELKASIRHEYEFLLNALQSHEDWGSQDQVTGAMAQLPHMAYHLGAIRQLIKL